MKKRAQPSGAAGSPQPQAPKKAMVLCAGLGKRMRPLTDKTPKPLLAVRGRSLVDRILDRLVEAGVEEAVVNLHYLGEQLEAQLSKRDDIKITFSWEREEVLETGGGVKQALPLLGGEPFFLINGDVLWLRHRLRGAGRLHDGPAGPPYPAGREAGLPLRLRGGSDRQAGAVRGHARGAFLHEPDLRPRAGG